MNKVFIAAAAALVAFAGCTKNVVLAPEGNNAITYQTVVGKPSSKVLISDTAYPTNVTFGTYAFKSTAFPADAELYIPESEVRNETGATSDAAWTTDIPYYWPQDGGKLTFISFSPWSINGSVTCTVDDGLKITDYDVDANQETDVMVADLVKDQTANGTNGGYTGVPTVFRHKLSQIVNFTAKTAEIYADGTKQEPRLGDKFFEIQKIEILGLYFKGTYTYTLATDSEQWTVTSTDSKDYTWFSGNKAITSTKSDIAGTIGTNDYLLVLPQPFTEGQQKIKVSYTVKTCTGVPADSTPVFVTETIEKEISLRSDPVLGFQKNKKITYNLTFGLDQIYWAPSVENWEAENGGDITI